MKNTLLCMAVTVALLLSMPILTVSAQKAEQSNPTDLLLFGDSIATGYGLSSDEINYGQQLAQAFGLTGSKYTNLAHDGDTSGDLLVKISDSAAGDSIQKADTVVISIGGNDVLGPFFTLVKTAIGHPEFTSAQLEAAIAADPVTTISEISASMQSSSAKALFDEAVKTFGTNFSQIIRGILEVNPNAHIYVQTVYNPFSGLNGLDSLSSFAESILGELNAAIVQGASSGQYTAVDIHGIFSGKAITDTNIARFDIHPNATGHSAIFNAIYKVITGKTYNSVEIDTTRYQMPVKGQYQIGLTLTGTKAAAVKVHSTSGKTAIVTEMKNGNYRVTAKNVGTAYIMFDVYDGKSKFLTHASVRIDVKTGIRPGGDSTRQIGVY